MVTFLEPTTARDLSETLRRLPAPYPDDTLSAQIRAENVRSGRKVVVLDDDPTGPQAMQDVYTLTGWTVASLQHELMQERPLFFVLTNTRALTTTRAVARVLEIAAAVREAGRRAGVEYTLMIRGDSTLRGHFPVEEDALGPFDGRILIPFFEEGGRYTYDDVQWVGEKGADGATTLMPIALTPYARDSAFGFGHSNLRNWVAEKSNGDSDSAATNSVSLDHLRTHGPDAVSDALLISRRQTTILNAITYRDLEVAALGLLRAEQRGKRFIVRCAASFVRVRAGQSGVEAPPPKLMAETIPTGDGGELSEGGLIIVGSHVPKTSAQLQMLLRETGIAAEELRVSALEEGKAADEVNRISQWLNVRLAQGQNAIVFTSREVEPRGTEAGLAIGSVIASALVDIVRNLRVRPRFMLAKGGWTSSEIGIRALQVERAYSPAPILPGVPLWRLGPETRFPGMPYVIFPGNVGSAEALVSAVRQLAL